MRTHDSKIETTEYLSSLRRRARSTMEGFIQSEDLASMEWLCDFGWFSQRDFSRFLEFAGKLERKLAWLWLFQKKNQQACQAETQKDDHAKSQQNCQAEPQKDHQTESQQANQEEFQTEAWQEQDTKGRATYIWKLCSRELCLEFPFLLRVCEGMTVESLATCMGENPVEEYANWIKLFSSSSKVMKRRFLEVLIRELLLQENHEVCHELLSFTQSDLLRMKEIYGNEGIDKSSESPTLLWKQEDKCNGKTRGNGNGENASKESTKETSKEASKEIYDKDSFEADLDRLAKRMSGRGKRRGDETFNIWEQVSIEKKGKYHYRNFLRRFMKTREEMEIDGDTFDYIYYTLGMENYGNIPLIEELEYKEVNRLDQLVIAIDTSGSCKKEVVQRFLEETYAIISGEEHFFKKMIVYIIQCDCSVQKVDIIHSEKEWKEFQKNIEIQGRGGTNFTPVFHYVEQEQKAGRLSKLKALIYFTDGDGVYPVKKPPYETAFVFLQPTEQLKYVPKWSRGLIVEKE